MLRGEGGGGGGGTSLILASACCVTLRNNKLFKMLHVYTKCEYGFYRCTL